MQEKLREVLPNTKLRAQRRGKQWTQVQLAEALGVTELTVRRWERGQVMPSAYHVKKLCDLFTLSPEELGVARVEIPNDVLQMNADALEELAIDNGSVEKKLESGYAERKYVGDKYIEELKASFVVHPQPVVMNVAAIKRKWQALVVRYGLLWPVIGLLLILFSPYTDAGPNVQPVRFMLYQANWSQGFGQWSGSPNWQWLAQEGGMLTTSQSVTNNVLLVPYWPTSANYVVEVQIKRNGYAVTDGRAYGLVVDMTPGGGYICGVGAHYLPEHFFVGHISLTMSNLPFYQIADFAALKSHLDNNWHTYSVEIKNKKMIYLIDGIQVQQVTIPANVPAGNVGIYVDHAAIAVKNFEIYSVH